MVSRAMEKGNKESGLIADIIGSWFRSRSRFDFCTSFKSCLLSVLNASD